LIGQQSSIRPTNQGLLSRLPENLFRSLFSRATTVRLKTDEVLFLAGDPGDGCYRVLDGLLKVVMTSDGNERILALLGLGAIVEIRMRAERRAGELLMEMRDGGQREGAGGDRKSKSRPAILIPKLSDIGVTATQSSRWQRLAALAPDTFEAKVEGASKRAYDGISCGFRQTVRRHLCRPGLALGNVESRRQDQNRARSPLRHQHAR
jgi:hypothetical protein